MADQTPDTGLRYSRFAAWAPPVIMVLGLVLLAVGELTVGFLMVLAAVIFWVVVRRRKVGAGGGGSP
jgi:Na+/pantothenate symporter